MSTLRINSLIGLLCCAIFAATGCSETDVGAVTGTITVDGHPANEGSIGFVPLDGKSRSAGAAIQKGKYETMVPLGDHKVEIRVPRVVGQTKLYNTANSETMPILEEALPAKYNSQTELHFDVKPGANEKNFDLKSK